MARDAAMERADLDAESDGEEGEASEGAAKSSTHQPQSRDGDGDELPDDLMMDTYDNSDDEGMAQIGGAMYMEDIRKAWT